ncbi:DNA-binding response regulator [Pseudoalteromonas sp. A25]|uniref:LytR/AlgR family response regulator transcription factor n=1 Tax=Pseudoalteromonas sp. A25 TaxID=116092 RepID=UPI0012605B67|nr:LytTR family DNA-binding domain-containing protein [Pseudoalteromonas sp. A25]BBN82199.1 DNA-binding response regulator [Pseudoalteromonas sp. A25]
MKPLKALIVDDEPLAREALRLRLEVANDIEIVGEADNGEDALLLAAQQQPDVVFLDINMPRLCGIEAGALLAQYCNAYIVFVSAYQEHAIEAFRLNAIDYLTKPINDEFFAQTLTRLRQRQINHPKDKQVITPKHQYLKRIALKEGGETRMVDTQSIISVESANDYLCIKVANQTMVIRKTMKQLSTLLDPQQFIRCHRSHLLNISMIESMQQTDEGVYLCCQGHMHPVSRRYLGQVKAKLKAFYP